MKSLLIPILALGIARSLAAQDTTKQAAPPAAAAPASSANVEAVLARNIADRAPQDSGTAFSDSVGTVVLWMRVTCRSAMSHSRSADRPGEAGAANRCRLMQRERGTSKSVMKPARF